MKTCFSRMPPAIVGFVPFSYFIILIHIFSESFHRGPRPNSTATPRYRAFPSQNRSKPWFLQGSVFRGCHLLAATRGLYFRCRVIGYFFPNGFCVCPDSVLPPRGAQLRRGSRKWISSSPARRGGANTRSATRIWSLSPRGTSASVWRV